MTFPSIISVRVVSRCTLLTFVLVFLLSNVTVGAEKCGSLERATIALRLALTLRPELEGRDLSLSFNAGLGDASVTRTTVGNIGIAIDKPESLQPAIAGKQPDLPSQSPQTRDGDVEFPMYLDFSFIDYNSGTGGVLVCRPVKFMNNTPTKQMEEARTAINAHPEWTEEQELHFAVDHGLRFTPTRKADLLKAIPWKELSAFYGPLRVKSATFQINGNGDKCAGCTFADLQWYVSVEEVGTPRKLLIFVEPFNGRIDAIGE